MRKTLKIFTLSLVVMMAGAGLAACGNSGSADTDTDKTAIEDTVKTYYKVAFNANADNVANPDEKEVEAGGKLTKPQDPVRENYVLIGWYTDAGLKTAFNFNTDTVDANMTLYAKWELVKYTVKFNTNGGGTIPSQSIGHGNPVIRPGEPRKNGYIFAGWYTADGQEFGFLTMKVTQDITLYARWNLRPVEQFTVTFHTNTTDENNDEIILTQTVADGEKIDQGALIELSKDGYAFGGWYADPNFTTGTRFDLDAYTVSSDTNLYAKWDAAVVKHTVTFDANGGNFGVENDTAITQTTAAVIHHQTTNAPAQADQPTRDGYLFQYWYSTDANTAFAFNKTPITADVTLYAHWERIFTVTFDLNGAAGSVAAQTLKSGEVVIEPTAPTREGYEFNGWYTDTVNSENKFYFGEYAYVYADTTLYAHWWINNGEYSYMEIRNHAGDVTAYSIVKYNGNDSTLAMPNEFNGKPVISIAETAFEFCNVTAITLPANVTQICSYAFAYTGLTTVNIPDTVTSIDHNAFYGCRALTTVTIGKNVTKIDNAAFGICPNLETITVAAENPDFTSCDSLGNPINGIIRKDNQTLIMGCSKTTVPDNITTIGANAFEGCESLTAITIPDSVTCIDRLAFANCKYLTEIVIPASVTKINSFAFVGCDNLEKITFAVTETEAAQRGWTAFNLGLTIKNDPDNAQTTIIVYGDTNN